MPKLIDRVQENRFIALFVGRHHSGKTVAEASFDKPMQIEDFDGRVGGAQVPWLDLTGIDYTYYPPKMDGLITKLNEKLEGLQASNILGQPIPRSWITDSITNMTLAFIFQALPLTHQKRDKNNNEQRGKYIGLTAMPGPEDYGLEAQATYEYIAFLKSLPINNVIFSAHTIGLFEKEDPDNPFSPSVQRGEKLSIRDKIGENIQTSFDHVFKFERVTEGREDKYYVTFKGGIACTSYDWLPSGRQEWTRKNFKEFMLSFKKKEAATAK
jgi:hypothetical protein